MRGHRVFIDAQTVGKPGVPIRVSGDRQIAVWRKNAVTEVHAQRRTVPALIVPDNRILSGRIVADSVEVIVCICTDGSYSITAEADKQPWESLGNSIRNDYVDDSPSGTRNV